MVSLHALNMQLVLLQTGSGLQSSSGLRNKEMVCMNASSIYPCLIVWLAMVGRVAKLNSHPFASFMQFHHERYEVLHYCNCDTSGLIDMSSKVWIFYNQNWFFSILFYFFLTFMCHDVSLIAFIEKKYSFTALSPTTSWKKINLMFSSSFAKCCTTDLFL